MESNQTRLHAIVSGRVQGVGFRFFVVEVAQGLGLTGWVRNLWDETVEVLAEGSRPALENLLAELNHGPEAAFVTDVTTEWQPATGEFNKFRIRSLY